MRKPEAAADEEWLVSDAATGAAAAAASVVAADADAVVVVVVVVVVVDGSVFDAMLAWSARCVIAITLLFSGVTGRGGGLCDVG